MRASLILCSCFIKNFAMRAQEVKQVIPGYAKPRVAGLRFSMAHASDRSSLRSNNDTRSLRLLCRPITEFVWTSLARAV